MSGMKKKRIKSGAKLFQIIDVSRRKPHQIAGKQLTCCCNRIGFVGRNQLRRPLLNE